MCVCVFLQPGVDCSTLALGIDFIESVRLNGSLGRLALIFDSETPSMIFFGKIFNILLQCVNKYIYITITYFVTIVNNYVMFLRFTHHSVRLIFKELLQMLMVPKSSNDVVYQPTHRARIDTVQQERFAHESDLTRAHTHTPPIPGAPLSGCPRCATAAPRSLPDARHSPTARTTRLPLTFAALRHNFTTCIYLSV